ncbi:bifunctional [glutamate--ammonia ligase]-adenylyl-L-tyrosine phosphorylase/[glutamate--ammonia-ligase] adenylyltransferase [Kaarinaea lacus]
MSKQLTDLLSLYPESVQQRLHRDWEALLQGMDDKAWVESNLLHHKVALFRVWGLSEFASKYCVAYPSVLAHLIDSNDLFRRYPGGHYAHSLRHQLSHLESETELHQCLRRFRNREMMRIAWRDINSHANLMETMHDLSSLADACIAETLHLLHHWLVKDLGQPQDKHGNSQRMMVVAMGKLGAYELNYSSDIDLIFIYPEPGETRNVARTVSNEQFFTRLSKQLIAALDKRTGDGFVFRVDMRLRPFGESGPLVVNLDALENYYQSHGREWERYAFIKARVVTGDPEPTDELVQMLRPFVYRRYLDYGAYESLREMKQLIVAEVERKGLKDNIKLGAGGIREIEFIGQAFQLIRGGRDPELQQKQILHTLDVLSEKNQLPAYVVNELKEAYQFLRTTEHRLQQVHDAQTHQLPKNPDEQLCIALSMGFDSWNAFYRQLQFHRQRVRNHFDQVFEAPQISQSDEVDRSLQLKQIWLQKIEDDKALVLLGELGYEHPAPVLDILKSLGSTASIRSLSRTGRQRLDALMPLLVAAVAPKKNGHEVLKRILELIQAISRRSSYLALLLESPMALSQLIKLCAASPWIAHQLKQHPLLLDELLDPRTLYHPPTREDLKRDLKQRLAHISADDLEQQMDALRHFKQANVLRVAAADVSGAVPLMIVSDHLTYIAEIVVANALEMAWSHMTLRHGTPAGADASDTRHHFAVIAYGKLGGIELSYGSDLDLVFLYDADPNGFTNGKKSIANGVFYARLGQRLIHILNAFTPAGDLYEVDMRLRPSGESGLLVTHIDSFMDYQLKKAWTWEHQALVRARPVAGDLQVIEHFHQMRRDVLRQKRDIKKLRKEVVDMREKMRKELVRTDAGFLDLKQGEGGIADIEFMVQYMVLAWAVTYENLVTYSDNIRILDAIAEDGLFAAEECQDMADIYREFRAAIHKIALLEQPAVVAEDKVAKQRARICEIWQRYMLVDS